MPRLIHRPAPSAATLALGVLIAVGLGNPASADKVKNPTAVFAGLDKITGRIIAFEAAVDETVQFGSLQLTARVCYSRPEYENPQTTTFLEVDEVNIENQYKRLFTGWMFAGSPGLNAIEHPVYDVWLTDCKGGTEIIKTPPEKEDEEPPPQPVELRRNTPARPVQPVQNRPIPAGQQPLRLPGNDGLNAPPGNVGAPPRPAPQQRFFPTNQAPAPGRGYDPAGGGNR
jgi:hypothetical protein